MTDPALTNDLPPERPLSDQARAWRKAELLEDITEQHRSGRRWLVPVLAAASVVAVVAVGGAVRAGGDDPVADTGSPAGPGPAAPSNIPDPPTDRSSLPPGEPDAPETVPGEGTSSHPVDEPGFPVQPAETCSDLRIPLPGATEVGSIEIGATTVHLFGNDAKWVVCDDWASLDGGVATLLAPHAHGAPIDQAQVGISMNFSTMADAAAAEYVAGGALPEGVESITYTFSDGHQEAAVLDGDLWAMAYFVDDTRKILEGATVEVVTDGVAEEFTLTVPEDFCSQTNHGC